MLDSFDLLAIVIILILLSFIMGLITGVSLSRPKSKSL